MNPTDWILMSKKKTMQYPGTTLIQGFFVYKVPSTKSQIAPRLGKTSKLRYDRLSFSICPLTNLHSTHHYHK